MFDQYGSAEQVCFISQCEAGSYHVHPEYGFTELLDTDEGPRDAKRIVATGFTNWAMPLLRYDTGDLAVPAAGKCPCGRNTQLVEGVLGRVDDYLIASNGAWVGRLDPVFKGLTTVRKAQIVQETLGEVRICIVPGKGFRKEHEQVLQKELRRGLEQICRSVSN